jgi:tetratricopeptide (TPR) repeat protein
MLHQFSLPEFEASTLRFKEEAAFAILALQHGETSFVADESLGLEMDALSFLEQTLHWLNAANDHEFIQGILDQLRNPNCQYAEAMLQASLATLKGNLEGAVSHYQSAAQISRSMPEPHRRAAYLLEQKGNREAAIEAYRAAIALTKDPIDEQNLQLQLLEQLKLSKRFLDAEQTLERLLVLDPSQSENKSFMRQFAKIKAKADAARPTRV